MNDRLRTKMLFYIVSGTISVMIFCAVAAMAKYKPMLSDHANSLLRVKGSLVQMKGSLAGMEESVRNVKNAIPADFYSRPPEVLIMEGLDALKSRMSGAEIKVSNIEDKGNEISVSVNIKALMTDYTAFVNNIGYLQSMSFPFFQIKNVSVSKLQDKDHSPVYYNVDGVMRLPRRMKQ